MIYRNPLLAFLYSILLVVFDGGVKVSFLPSPHTRLFIIMSGLSSNQQSRPRTMASDISKLFRSVSSSPQKGEKETEAPTSSETPTDKAGSTKKKITRIPLFGRTRKKSNHSSSSSPYASTSLIRGSTDIGEMSSRPPSSEFER